MTIYEQLVAVCSGTEGKLLTATEIKNLVVDQFGTNPTSVLPSDYCYNRWNQGIKQGRALFVRVGAGEYRYVGPDYPYTGLVFWWPKSEAEGKVVGEWVNGQLRLYEVATISADSKSLAPATRESTVSGRSTSIPLSKEQLDRLSVPP